MFLFYVDETGNRDPRIQISKKNGEIIENDWLYVLTAVCIFEHRWHGFEKTLNRHKIHLMNRIWDETGVRLDLSLCEIKSNWIRVPKEREKHPFLKYLSDQELKDLVDLFYTQLLYHNMHILTVLVDKRYLLDYMDQEKIHRKSWELLLEQVQRLMSANYEKHQALLVNDDVSREMNQALAMKHAYLLDQGTKNNLWLTNICEMPMFVRSELSNGVQLADLCSYNIYRAFKGNNLTYPFFKKIQPRIWSRSSIIKKDSVVPFSGVWVFPANSPLRDVVKVFEKERASINSIEAQDF